MGSSAVAEIDRRTMELSECQRLWPSGRVETVANVAANQIITVEEGRGIVAHQPFSR